MIDDGSRKLLRNMVICGQAVFIAWAIAILGGGQTVMDAMPYLLMYTILMVVLWCLWTGKYGKSGPKKQMGTRETQNVPALDTDEMPKCPCCGRPCHPVTDISGRRMCPWCGNYMRHR